MSKVQLHTERLTLRPITLSDADYVLQQLNDPGWLKYIGDRNIHSLEAAEEYISTKIIAAVENGIGTFFVVIRQADPEKEIIGQCGVFKRDGLGCEDLGFAFLEKYCGKGYGYEASKAVLTYAQETLKIKKLVAITSDENLASQALLRKLGMRHTDDILLPKIEGNNMLYEF